MSALPVRSSVLLVGFVLFPLVLGCGLGCVSDGVFAHGALDMADKGLLASFVEGAEVVGAQEPRVYDVRAENGVLLVNFYADMTVRADVLKVCGWGLAYNLVILSHFSDDDYGIRGERSTNRPP